MKLSACRYLAAIFTFLLSSLVIAGLGNTIKSGRVKIIDIAKGWAENSVNDVIFRSNSVVTFKDYQFVSFYDPEGNVILAKRKLDSDKWTIHKTKYKGDVKDAHKCISIMVDGDGYLHMAWNHHGSPLNYCRSKIPGGLEMTDKMPMTGIEENHVTYPQFFKMPDGNLIFFYRDGGSGNGNLVIDYYDTRNKKWINLHKNLVDGEGKRNAYWEAFIDKKGTIYLSWVWRETPDVETNHDICFAESKDGGKTWLKTNGERYKLPINAESAEYAARIPQSHELINQTSMCADENGHPYIANYWVSGNSKVPQYRIVYYNGNKWIIKQVTHRTTAFSLSGGGTKRIPISRPQIMVDKKGVVYIIYRDSERGSRVTVGICRNINENIWKFKDLTSYSVGMWEPTYDTELWEYKNILDLFVQNVGQGDAETLQNLSPQMISVLKWIPDK